jgi:hypothetical protein
MAQSLAASPSILRPLRHSFLIEIRLGPVGQLLRHNCAVGFNADLEKYFAAGLAGKRVYRFSPDQITLENVERLAEHVGDEILRFSTKSTFD